MTNQHAHLPHTCHTLVKELAIHIFTIHALRLVD